MQRRPIGQSQCLCSAPSRRPNDVLRLRGGVGDDDVERAGVADQQHAIAPDDARLISHLTMRGDRAHAIEMKATGHTRSTLAL